MLSEKEKLQEELRFLKESFDSGVISKEEHEDAISNIDARLRELEVSEEVQEKAGLKEEEEKIEIKELKTEDVEKPAEESTEEPKEEVKEEEPGEDTISIDLTWLKKIFRRKSRGEEKPVEEVEEKDTEQKTLDNIKEEEQEEVQKEEEPKEEAKEEEEKVTEEKVVEKKEAEVEEEKKEPVKEEVKVEEKKVAEVEEELKEEEEKEKAIEEIKEEEKPVEEVKEEEPRVIIEEEKKGSNKLAYIAVILIIVIGSWYFFFSGSGSDVPVELPDESLTVLAACNSDDDCIKEGSIGICNFPGLVEAACEYMQDVEIKLTILNSNQCFNCRTSRVLSILNEFFPNLEIETVDFDTEQGKEIQELNLINALPAYIFDSNFELAYNYDKFSTSFNAARENFVMKNTVANANFYVNRESISNKLDLIVKQDQTASLKAEENLQEFLGEFKVDFEKHDKNSEIAKELGINTFPIFLINNKIKFDGVQSADKIRENFCKLNNATACALGLTKSLI